MKLLVTGASGAIGRQLVPLLGQKYLIRIAGRDISKLADLFPTFECANLDDLPLCVEGVDAIVHLAARNNDVGGVAEDFIRDNVELTEYLVDAAVEAKIRHFVFISSFRALQPSKKDYYGLSKREAENVLTGKPGISVSILRLAAVDTGAMRGKVSILRWLPKVFRAPLLSLVNAFRPTTSIDQVSEAIESALDKDEKLASLVSQRQMNNPAYMLIKRGLDIAGSLFLLFAVGWIMVLVALAIRIIDGSPVFFSQERLGRYKEPFVLYKFRTMKINAPERGTHEVSMDHVTRLGRLLRRTKLDELPQVLNIIKGELSIVGPRPCLAVQTKLVAEREARGIYDIKPGLSGLSQIQGIDMSDPVLLAQKDAEYAARRSVLFDAQIILNTLKPIAKK